jgi:subtilisin family serine protease
MPMRQIRSVISQPILALFLALLTSCGGGGKGGLPSAGGGGGAATAITVTPTSVTIRCDRVYQLVATGNNGADLTTTVTWSSDDPVNAPVSATTGLVTPPTVCTGSATITATLGLLTDTAAVTLATSTAAFDVTTVADPLAAQQWHLNNTGQNGYSDTAGTATEDINVNSVYNTYGIDGTGVIVAVVDTGLEIGHQDLSANVVPNGSWNFVDRTNDPTSAATDGDHGTAVAGLIASARNTYGGIGVASGASLKGFNPLIESPQRSGSFIRSLGGSGISSSTWVFNQSYGISTDSATSGSGAFESQLQSGVTSLRSGRGALYVKAAGNGFDDNGGAGLCAFANAAGISCENANFDPDNSTPYNIVVGALNANGEKSSYSTTGSALWVSAPGGEFGGNVAAITATDPNGNAYPAIVFEPAMVTTDQSSCAAGYARTEDINYIDSTTSIVYPLVMSTFDGNDGSGTILGTPHASNLFCNYTNTMNGTSSATPVTAGVIALILDANPSLTWRDVKHILASTSTQIQPGMAAISVALSDGPYTVEPAWTTNAAAPTPYRYHNWFGFGRVDAAAAVAMARTYPYGTLGPLIDTGWINTGAISVPIPDNSIVGTGPAPGTIGTTALNISNTLTVEAVQIRVSVTHSYNGDLGIELISPSGTRSVLKYIRDGLTDQNMYNYRLLTNAFYGESSTGVWTIKVVDGNALDTGSLTAWSIRIYGH